MRTEPARHAPPESAGKPEDACQARHRSDFASLLNQHEAALLRTARRLCAGNEDAAQDLLQDTAVKGYTAYLAGRFQDGTHCRAWLLRILTNTFINDYHHKKRWEDPADIDTLEMEGAAPLRAASADQPENVLLASALDEPVERAVASLSPELRACIELVDIGELDYAEAAETLSVPIGTVRSRLFRARQQLHRALYRYAEQRGLVTAFES
jgi:RNA polymerase sigma-70 factor (ECF subfamily)